MQVRFRTQTGSIYVLDSQKMTWKREKTTEQSGKIRTEEGKILMIFPDVVAGMRVIIATDSPDGGHNGRTLFTSPVEEILSITFGLQESVPALPTAKKIEKIVDQALESLKKVRIKQALVAFMLKSDVNQLFVDQDLIEDVQKHEIHVYERVGGGFLVESKEQKRVVIENTAETAQQTA